jgi:hypothetical protein
MEKGIFGIAALFIGVAFAALLVGHAQGAATVIKAVSSGFGMDLATVELAGGYAGNSGIGSQYGSFAGFGNG